VKGEEGEENSSNSNDSRCSAQRQEGRKKRGLWKKKGENTRYRLLHYYLRRTSTNRALPSGKGRKKESH